MKKFKVDCGCTKKIYNGLNTALVRSLDTGEILTVCFWCVMNDTKNEKYELLD